MTAKRKGFQLAADHPGFDPPIRVDMTVVWPEGATEDDVQKIIIEATAHAYSELSKRMPKPQETP